MPTPTPPAHGRTRRLDTAAVAALAVFAALAGWALREWAGYPLDPSDERNWIVVAAEAAKGVNGPISGALHFAATRALADGAGLSHAGALALMGVASIPLVLAAYAASYRLMGFARAWPALMLLATSTYFWAPLLESRPQQWGQALVLLCATLAWRALSRADRAGPAWHALAWGSWSLLFLLTCWVHILSGPIALGLCGLLAVGCLALRPRRWPRVALWALASVPGLLVLALPTGPYRTMQAALSGDHLKALMPWLGTALPLGLLATLALALAARAFGPALVRAGLRSVARHPLGWAACLGSGIFAFLALQALMLPEDAWVFYRGSVAIFVLKQSGNLFFLGALLAGVLHLARQPGLHGTPPWPGQTALLACMALLAAGALALSALAHDTNWMLRLINYALPIAAPFAALGFAQWRLGTGWKVALLLLAGTISLGTAGGIA